MTLLFLALRLSVAAISAVESFSAAAVPGAWRVGVPGAAGEVVVPSRGAAGAAAAVSPALGQGSLPQPGAAGAPSRPPRVSAVPSPLIGPPATRTPMREPGAALPAGGKGRSSRAGRAPAGARTGGPSRLRISPKEAAVLDFARMLSEYDADLRSFFRAEKYFAPPMLGAAAGGAAGSLIGGAAGTVIGAVAGSGIGGLISVGMAVYDCGFALAAFPVR